MVEDLKVGPYSVPLLPLYDGPLPEAKAGSETEPIALLLNNAVGNPDGGRLEAAIREGKRGGDVTVYVSPPANASEDEALRAEWSQKSGEMLEAGAVAMVGATLQGGGDLAVSWAALRDGLDQLQAIRRAWKPEPGPWLFLRRSKCRWITPQDYELIKKLEEEAATVDALDFEAEVGAEPYELIVRRRQFLQACEACGLFAEDNGAEREKWLDHWFAERLLALRQAALKLRAWKLLGADEDPSIGRVTLDYVRHELWPPGEDGRSWALLAFSLADFPSQGEQGAVLRRAGGVEAMRLWWRRDSDQPMLLAAARG